jgi:hypothetical protein
LTLLTAHRIPLGAIVKPLHAPFHFLVVDIVPPNTVVCARPDAPEWTTRAGNLIVVKQPRVWKDRPRGRTNR